MINGLEYLPEPSLGFKYKGLGNAKLPASNAGMANSMLGSLGDMFGLSNPLGWISAIGSGVMSAINGANPDLSGIENYEKSEMDRLTRQRNVNPVTSLDDAMQQMANLRTTDTSQYAADNLYEDKNLFGNIAEHGLIGGISRNIFGDKKGNDAARATSAKLISQAKSNDLFKQQSYQNMLENINAKNNRSMFSQIAAYGGPIGISLSPVDGAINYMQNEELLSSLGEDKTKNNNGRMSMPMFAFGGALGGYGGDWSNGLNFIKAGGTHGENPIGGVPMGIAQDGMPNLVEEGEVVWNDYVFSNRINVPKETMERLGIKGKDPMTFAEAVEKAQKSSAERPNDPIEKRGLDAVLAGLMQKQEEIRQSKAEEEQFNEMEDMAAYAADGGPIHIAKNKKGTFTAAATKLGSSPFKALGGHLFYPGGPKNPPYYGDIVYGRGLGAIDEGSLMENMMIMGPQDYYIPNFYSNVLGANAGYREVADKPKSTIQPKPFAQSPIKQNPTPIYLPDDSEMNRYVAATNPLAIHNSAISDNLGFKYSGLGTTYNVASTTNTNNNGQRDLLPTSGWQTGLRYLPAIAPAISLGYSLFNGPDYSYADELDAAGNDYAEAIGNSGRVTPKFLGDYLAYDPFDRLFYANELGAQQAATNSAIMNQSSGNRGAAMAALLSSGYNNNVGLGKLFREGEEYNRAQRERVAEFNRGTNQYNSTLDMQAQELNARANQAKAEALLNNKYRVLGMKQAIDNQRDQSISLALTNLFDNLGDVGRESYIMDMVRNNPALLYDWLGNYKGKQAKNGGYLTIKNRRRK